jgi:hypothetical protein
MLWRATASSLLPDFEVDNDVESADRFVLVDTEPTVPLLAPVSVPAKTPVLLLVDPSDRLLAN